MADAPRRVPTAILTGFLGVGKTTALRHLLRHKPVDEYWAVVLNEFGEVSIDGALVANASDGVTVREIPGGCICCATAPVLRVGIQRLLQQRWPDRLLIEPTGLGHPAKIVSMLQDPWMSRSLWLKSVLCIVDAREFAQEKFREHPIYAEQLRAATAIVVNKAELSTEAQRGGLTRHLAAMPTLKPILGYVSHGAIDVAWLDSSEQLVADDVTRATTSLLSARTRDVAASPIPTPSGVGEFARVTRAAEGYQSYAWIFSSETLFAQTALVALFDALGDAAGLGAEVVRAKCLVHVSEQCAFSASWRAGEWSSEKVDGAKPQSSIEVVIASETEWLRASEFEEKLRAAVLA